MCSAVTDLEHELLPAAHRPPAEETEAAERSYITGSPLESNISLHELHGSHLSDMSWDTEQAKCKEVLQTHSTSIFF